MRAEHAEQIVLRKIATYIADLRGDIGAEAARRARAQRAGQQAADVDSELAATRRAMARATERWAREQIDDRTYEDTMRSLRETEADLAHAATGLRGEAALPAAGKLIALGERLLKLWPSMTADQQNRALRDMIEKIEIWPAAAPSRKPPADSRVTIQWR